MRTAYTADQQDEYDDAFQEGDADEADGMVRNDYDAGTPGHAGYAAGVKHGQKTWVFDPFDDRIPGDTPCIQSANFWGTGEGQFHGVIG